MSQKHFIINDKKHVNLFLVLIIFCCNQACPSSPHTNSVPANSLPPPPPVQSAIAVGFAMGAAAKFGISFSGSVAQLFAAKAMDKLGNGIQVSRCTVRVGLWRGRAVLLAGSSKSPALWYNCFGEDSKASSRQVRAVPKSSDQ